jgi:hypothetical protein
VEFFKHSKFERSVAHSKKVFFSPKTKPFYTKNVPSKKQKRTDTEPDACLERQLDACPKDQCEPRKRRASNIFPIQHATLELEKIKLYIRKAD